MTTNESMKWSEWKDDIAEGLVFRNLETGTENAVMGLGHGGQKANWPLSTKQRLINRALEDVEEQELHQPPWARVQSLDEVENIYDLGFIGNLKDVLKIS